MATTVVLEYANDVIRSPDEDVEFERKILRECREILHQEGVITSAAIREYLRYRHESALLSDILGHPQEMPSVREFDYLNPDVKRSNIEYHLGKLVEAGLVEKLTLPTGDRKRDLPSTFYGLTEYGRSVLDEHGLLDEQPVWKAVNQRVEKPPEIRDAEEMPRPSRS